jgi:hypothetical protein
MRTRVLLVAAALSAATLAGCSGGDDSAGEPGALSTSFPPIEPSPEPAQALSIGKSVVPLAAGSAYRSPDGFAPQVTVSVTGDGWASTHRSTDAFDLSQPLPDVDAALVVYAFLVPPEQTNKDALAAVADRAEEAGATVERTGDVTITVTGGDGPLVASRDGGIALDAVPSGYARVTSRFDRGPPLLTVWWVPDSTYADQAEALAGTLAVVAGS